MGMMDILANIMKVKKEKMTILVIGLNSCGKSTVINYLKGPDKQKSVAVPTVGFAIEEFQSHGVSITTVDMSGTAAYRNLWTHYLTECQGIVYVIDSSDRMRLVVVKDELERLLKHPDLERRRIPILFFGNKIDCEGSLSSVKLAAAVGLDRIKKHPWQIISSNAILGDGLEEGVQWLIHQARLSMWRPNEH